MQFIWFSYAIHTVNLARQTGLASGVAMPSSIRNGRRTAWPNPGRLGAGICLLTSTIKTPPAEIIGSFCPMPSQKFAVRSQNRFADGGAYNSGVMAEFG